MRETNDVDDGLLDEITRRYRNLLVVIHALKTADVDDCLLDEIGGDGGVVDAILECPSRDALWRVEGWVSCLNGDHAYPGESYNAGRARLLRETLIRELTAGPHFKAPNRN